MTALNDGLFQLPVDKLLQTSDPTLVLRRLQEAYLGIPLATSVYAYLVHTGQKLVLIDTGHAGAQRTAVGGLADEQQIEAAGVAFALAGALARFGQHESASRPSPTRWCAPTSARAASGWATRRRRPRARAAA